jgi:hypothetical protein
MLLTHDHGSQSHPLSSSVPSRPNSASSHRKL